MSAVPPKFPRHIPIVITDIADMPVEADICVSARVCDIADMVHAELVLCPHVIATLEKIHEKYPALYFSTFVAAMRLVELASRKPGGHA